MGGTSSTRTAITMCLGWARRLVVLHRSCSRFFQVVVAEEEFDSPAGILDLLGAGPGSADEACQALPQRVVAALDGIGFSGVLRDRCVVLCRHDAAVYCLLVRVTRGVVVRDRGERGPQGVGTRAAPLPHGQRHTLPCGSIHR